MCLSTDFKHDHDGALTLVSVTHRLEGAAALAATADNSTRHGGSFGIPDAADTDIRR